MNCDLSSPVRSDMAPDLLCGGGTRLSLPLPCQVLPVYHREAYYMSGWGGLSLSREIRRQGHPGKLDCWGRGGGGWWYGNRKRAAEKMRSFSCPSVHLSILAPLLSPRPCPIICHCLDNGQRPLGGHFSRDP